MNLFARKIIAWTLAETMDVSTVIETIEKAKARRDTDLPLIIHSDVVVSMFQGPSKKLLQRCSVATLIVAILMITPASNPSIH